MITKIENIGGISALIIGLPIGFIFSAFTLYISLFPMFDFGIAFLGGKLFWSPIIWGGIIPLTYILLLWRAGKKFIPILIKDIACLNVVFYLLYL